MYRLVFRILVAFTMIGMFYGRLSGGRLPLALFPAFYYWFLISVLVFGAFGINAGIRAWREPHNRRAYYADIVLAVMWIPYWWVNLH